MKELGLYLIFMRYSDIWGEDNDTNTKAWPHSIQSITQPNWGFCCSPSDTSMLFYSHGNCSIIPNYMIITPFCALKTFYLCISPLLLQPSMYFNCCICESILLFHSPTLKIVKSRPEYSSFLYACILQLCGNKDTFVGLK